MIKLKEVEAWFNDLRDLILDVNICVTNARRITNNVYENEENLKKTGFFYHYQLQQAFIISVQLCKILTDTGTQKRNAHKLFKTIVTQDFDTDLEKHLCRNGENLTEKKNEIINEINRLKGLIENQSELIAKVKIVRDKAYAHSDPDSVKLGPSLMEYQSLIDLSTKIYNELHLKLFGSTMVFEHTSPWGIDPVILLASKQLTNVKERKQKLIDSMRNRH